MSRPNFGSMPSHAGERSKGLPRHLKSVPRRPLVKTGDRIKMPSKFSSKQALIPNLQTL